MGLRVLAHRHDHGGRVSAEKRRQQRRGLAGTNGEGRRSEKKACGDIIEKSSSVDEVDAWRQRPRSNNRSHFSYVSHLQSDISRLFYVTTLSAHGFCSNGVWCRRRDYFHLTISRSLRLKAAISHDQCRSSSVPAPLNEFSHAGFAGVRLGKVRNTGTSKTR